MDWFYYSFFLDIHQIRSPRANRDQNSFEHLMRATSLELRTKLEPQMQNHAPASEIESIISKVGLKSNLSLGIPGNQTQVDYLVKFDQLDRDEIDYLSRLFNAHIARDIVEECDNGTNVTRIGIHRRRTTITDSSFMNSVVNGLSVKPAIVDLDRDGGQTRVLGRFNPGENAVFVQDVTLTGRTPIRCIGELRRAEVSVNKLYSFIARAEHIDQITNYCDTAKVEFLPFCVLSMDGRLRLAE